MFNYIKSKIIDYINDISQTKYAIGFTNQKIDDIIEGKEISYTWLKHKFKDRWFADPFILDITEQHIYLLVEEFFYKTQKGQITKLIVDKKTFKLIKRETVLSLKSHLSFPFIYRVNNDIYICPENSESYKLAIYKYNIENNRCIKIKDIINLPITDAVFTSFDNKGYIFATMLPNANNSLLYIYEYSLKTFEIGKSQKFIFNDNIARNAGSTFIYNNRLYRPAQECNLGYGHSTIIQEITYQEGIWDFKNIRQLTSKHPLLNHGQHTFNTYKDIVVIDINGFKNPIQRIIIDLILKLFQTIKKIL